MPFFFVCLFSSTPKCKFDQSLRGKCSWNPFCRTFIFFLADTWCFITSTVCDKFFLDTVINSADIPINLFLCTPNRIIEISFGRQAFKFNTKRSKFPHKTERFSSDCRDFPDDEAKSGSPGSAVSIPHVIKQRHFVSKRFDKTAYSSELCLLPRNFVRLTHLSSFVGGRERATRGFPQSVLFDLYLSVYWQLRASSKRCLFKTWAGRLARSDVPPARMIKVKADCNGTEVDDWDKKFRDLIKDWNSFP